MLFRSDLVALAAALFFAIHPIATGCGNYISARSSLLVGAFLMPALVLYLAALSGRRATPALAGSLILFVLAMFTKVEAVAFLGVIGLAEVLLSPATRERPILARFAHGPMWIRMAFFGLAAAAYLVVWKRVSPLGSATGRGIAGMSGGVYLLTEVRAWWYYIAQVLAPVRQVADEAEIGRAHV